MCVGICTGVHVQVCMCGEDMRDTTIVKDMKDNRYKEDMRDMTVVKDMKDTRYK